MPWSLHNHSPDARIPLSRRSLRHRAPSWVVVATSLLASHSSFCIFSQDINTTQPLVARRRLLSAAAPALLATLAPGRARAEKATKDELFAIAQAFALLNTDPGTTGAQKAYEDAEEALGKAIAKWESGAIQAKALVEEKARLRLGRARARTTLNDMTGGARPDKAAGAVKDYDVAIDVMDEDFRNNPGKAMYSEYPDALVKRGLAKEELKDWAGAASDYSKAIETLRPKDGRPDMPLRGAATLAEGDGLGMNPLILSFRGNAYSRLGKYMDALYDYQEATAIFENDRELREASLSRANEGLALYGAGLDLEADKVMQLVTRKDPGVTDAHVALAASYWSKKNVAAAESEWKFACEKIDTGCQKYKDLEWVSEIRRWPPPLVSALQDFLRVAK